LSSTKVQYLIFHDLLNEVCLRAIVDHNKNKHMTCLHNFSLNLEGKSPLGRPRSRWMNSINMDLKVIELDVTDMTGTSGRHL
jgi:hypothetical protein